jgi:DNA-binding LytR/AlgR family response regulator
MNRIKVLIIEDDQIWKLKLQMIVEKLGCIPLPICTRIEDVAAAIAKDQPDIIISDIQIEEHRTIFEVRKAFANIPVVFVTAHAAIEYQESAMCLPNAYFLVKPFHFLSFKAIIDKILSTLIAPQSTQNSMPQKTIEVTDKYRHRKQIPLEVILYLEAEGNYTFLHTENKKISIKRSLSKLSEELNEKFIQIQRGYIVNVKYITRVDYSRGLVYVNGNSLPLGRTYRKPMMDTLEQQAEW